MFWWTIALAWGQEPTLSVESDGTVVAVAEVDVPPERVRAVLDDVNALTKLTPEVLSVTEEPPDPRRCREVERETRGLVHPLRFSAMRCPTATGWHEDLVHSEDFDAYATDWSVTPDGSGSRIEYRVRTAVRLPIPSFALAAALKDAAAGAVRNLVHTVLPVTAVDDGGGGSPPPKQIR